MKPMRRSVSLSTSRRLVPHQRRVTSCLRIARVSGSGWGSEGVIEIRCSPFSRTIFTLGLVGISLSSAFRWRVNSSRSVAVKALASRGIPRSSVVGGLALRPERLQDTKLVGAVRLILSRFPTLSTTSRVQSGGTTPFEGGSTPTPACPPHADSPVHCFAPGSSCCNC